jgi:hypothetical protein
VEIKKDQSLGQEIDKKDAGHSLVQIKGCKEEGTLKEWKGALQLGSEEWLNRHYLWINGNHICSDSSTSNLYQCFLSNKTGKITIKLLVTWMNDVQIYTKCHWNKSFFRKCKNAQNKYSLFTYSVIKSQLRTKATFSSSHHHQSQSSTFLSVLLTRTGMPLGAPVAPFLRDLNTSATWSDSCV